MRGQKVFGRPMRYYYRRLNVSEPEIENMGGGLGATFGAIALLFMCVLNPFTLLIVVPIIIAANIHSKKRAEESDDEE